jgi:hypothetical protein
VHGATVFSGSRYLRHTDQLVSTFKTSRLAAGPPKRAAAKDDAAVAQDGASEGSQHGASCYVCLESEGAMLMNVCDCRWSRIHPACLEKLVEHDRAAACKCCTKRFTLPSGFTPPKPLFEQLWAVHPRSMKALVWGSVAEVCVGFAMFLYGALLQTSHTQNSLGVAGCSALGSAAGFVIVHGVFALCLFCTTQTGSPAQADTRLGARSSVWPATSPPPRWWLHPSQALAHDVEPSSSTHRRAGSLGPTTVGP